jgi:predicted GNAT superfamily acetyltransferase
VPSSSPSPVTIRDLSTPADYAAAERLQRDTWGLEFTECVPATILMISQKVGGVAAGAFSDDDPEAMLGFVFGLSGIRDGHLAHWSHMLAVTDAAQGLGLGRRLKLYQRDRLLALGIRLCYWTYDPLVARNAHLNINRLGARPTEYVPDMYGADTKSELHSGLGTDRFIVTWDVAAPETERALAGEIGDTTAWLAAPVVGGSPPPHHERLRIEVPEDIQDVKRNDPAAATHWRQSTQTAFLACFRLGYRVTGFQRDPATGRCYYLLHRM